MQTEIAVHAVVLVICIVAGWLVPAATVRRSLPVLAQGPLTKENYRGRRVVVGLGITWLAWATALLATQGLMQVATRVIPASSAWFGLVQDFSKLMFMAPPAGLVLGAAAFGLVDDVWGNVASRGFRGHLSALAKGRLTTGMMKMLGIGALSLAAASGPALRHYADVSRFSAVMANALVVIALWLLGSVIIALSANLVNLTDLRPGRALKVYLVLALPAAVTLWASSVREIPFSPVTLAIGAVDLTALLVVVAGPALAVWRPDHHEKGMLGDAGANAAGFAAGAMLVAALGVKGLIAAAVLLIALNLLSERVSFSEVIEGNPLLRGIDSLGRGKHSRSTRRREGQVGETPKVYDHEGEKGDSL